MTNQTRMRMSKDAAALIHDWRDEHEHETNAEAIHELFADYWATESKVMHLERFKSRYDEMKVHYHATERALIKAQKVLRSKGEELIDLNAALSDANIKIDRIRANLRLAVSQNVDLQSESLRKREQVASLEQSLLDQSIRHDRQLDERKERKERDKEKLRIKNEWLAIFAVSNVVGWGLAITALAGVMG